MSCRSSPPGRASIVGERVVLDVRRPPPGHAAAAAAELDPSGGQGLGKVLDAVGVFGRPPVLDVVALHRPHVVVRGEGAATHRLSAQVYVFKFGAHNTMCTGVDKIALLSIHQAPTSVLMLQFEKERQI